MIPFTINEIDFVVKEDISILEACKCVGIKIPRFCYHETLSIAGNCRMCLVRLLLFDDDGKESEDIDDALVVSCVTTVDSEIEIYSNDPVIQKAREEILEFLLLNHPLDCPICDQGGECDLQDQTKHFGSNRSKFLGNKSVVEDKDFGVFIKSIMTRCIHCTRCVRFSSEVAGIDFFGTLNRGGSTEIGLYAFNKFNSEISGNVIDLCPVGALTSKPYSFKARPWELKSVETIDLTDSLGSNIYANYVETDMLRILPKFNSEINESIITDKARFIYDTFNTPHILNTIEDSTAFIKSLKQRASFSKILLLVSEELNFEDFNLLKKIENVHANVRVRFVSNTLSVADSSNIFLNNQFNSIKNLNYIKNSIFMFATNSRTEVSLINARLRHLTSFIDYFNVYSWGFKFDDSIVRNSFINCNVRDLFSFMEGKSQKLSSKIVQENNCLVFLGSALSHRGFSLNDIQKFLKNLNPSLIFFHSYIQSNSSLNSYFNIKKCTNNDILKSDDFFFLKCRETSFLKKIFLLSNAKNIFWFNSYSLKVYPTKCIQIPLKSVYEEKGTFFNCEFRPQISQKVLEKRPESVFSFDILRSIFPVTNVVSNSNNYVLEFLDNPNLFLENSKKFYLEIFLKKHLSVVKTVFIKTYPVKPQVSDFYQSNYFTDFSKNMLLASKYFRQSRHNFF